MRILLADDHAPSRDALAAELEAYGVVTAVSNGFEAVQLAHTARRKGQAFDLIVLDLLMPLCDGLTALHTLRADERRSQTPAAEIWLLTMEPAVFERGWPNLDGVLTKPVRAEDLHARLGTAQREAS